ncbi:DUF4097 family beta strand repeat-containing protein [Streptosporangium sandarakinum]|uniref:DUF4097 family beta strand repeat-containing protein n=1 Tax=Streptosporangium sandarakinum TaxID=1260955 RepID=UPI003428E9B2
MRMNKTVVAAGLLGLTAVLAGCGLGGPEEHDTVSYDVGGQVTALRVGTDGGAIEVVESDRKGVHVTEDLTWRRDKPVTSHTTEGGTLTLKFSCPVHVAVGAGCDVSYRVEVPRGLPVRAESDSGRVTLKDLSGDVEARSDSGAIDATGLTGKNAVARTDSGAITFAFAGPPETVKTTTDSGRTEVRLPKGAYDIDTSTDSGRKEISAPNDPSAPRSVRLSSDSGDLKVTAA